MKKFPKEALRVVGGMLGISGVVFVAFRLHGHAQQIDFKNFSKTICLLMGFLAVYYGLANLMLARAWWHLLSFLKVRTPFRWAVRVYGLSQMAKYVPGNIVHLAVRQSYGMADGLPASSLVKSTVWELGLLAFSGATYVLLILPLAFEGFPTFLTIGIFVVAIAIIEVVSRKWFGLSVGAAFSCQISFLAMAGLVFLAILALVGGTKISLIGSPVICGAYVCSWLAGFVTPGAPAGIGVREMALIFLLEGRVEQADLLLAVVLGRVVSMVGDFLYFGVAAIARRKLLHKTP